MAKRIKDKSKKQPRIRDTSKKQPHIDPRMVAEKLGAEQPRKWRSWSIPFAPVIASKTGQVVEVVLHPESDGPFRPTAVFARGAVVRLVGLLVDGAEQLAPPCREVGLPFTKSGDPFATPVPAKDVGCIRIQSEKSIGPCPEITLRLKFKRAGRLRAGWLLGALYTKSAK